MKERYSVFKRRKESHGILRSREKIKDAQNLIKEEKRKIKKKKYEKFKNTKFGRFINNNFSFSNKKREAYSFRDILMTSFVSLIIGSFAFFAIFMIFFDGKNYFILSRELGKFLEVYNTLTHEYYGEVDKDELIEDAIAAMMASVGDIYTSYTDDKKSDEFNELVGGTYEGIGCSIQYTENGIIVAEVYDGGPAYKAGLKQNDLILFVDDKEVKDMTVDELATYIKTEADSKMKMQILRDNEKVDIELTRGTVETPVVTSKIYEKNGKKIGYLHISIFSAVADKQFKIHLEKLEKEGIDGLVIDVRDNSGGYLTTVTSMLNELLDKDKVIYQVEKNGKRKATKDSTLVNRDYPIAVLVNGASASASEILAAAIKEAYGGFVVGTTTYGKGTVQQTKKLSDGSMIKYTVENWLTPNGNWIDDVGIKPTHEIKLTEKFYNSPLPENDEQLQKALELVSE